MRILVCGGRNFRDAALIYATLDRIARTEVIDCIIEGDAPGADRIAGYWAKKRRVDLRLYPANWAKHGNAAGPIRNQRMIDQGKPDLVLAFPGGRGTEDMMGRAVAAGIRVVQVAGASGE